MGNPEPVRFSDTRDATLFCFTPEAREPLSVAVRFPTNELPRLQMVNGRPTEIWDPFNFNAMGFFQRLDPMLATWPSGCGCRTDSSLVVRSMPVTGLSLMQRWRRYLPHSGKGDVSPQLSRYRLRPLLKRHEPDRNTVSSLAASFPRRAGRSGVGLLGEQLA